MKKFILIMAVLICLAMSCRPSKTDPYQEARSLEDKGEVGQAIQKYYALINKNPGDARAQLRLAILLSATGELDKALAHYIEAVKLEPGNLQARLNFSGYHYKRKNYASAVAELQKIIELSPASPEADVARSLAVKVERTLIREEFITKLENELKDHPEREDLRAKLADALAEEAQELISDRNYQEAATKIQKAIDLNPKKGTLHLILSQVLDSLGQKNEAVESLKKALALEPQNLQYRFALAGFLIQLDKKDEGKMELEKIIELDPFSLEAEYARRRLKDFEAKAAEAKNAPSARK